MSNVVPIPRFVKTPCSVCPAYLCMYFLYVYHMYSVIQLGVRLIHAARCSKWRQTSPSMSKSTLLIIERGYRRAISRQVDLEITFSVYSTRWMAQWFDAHVDALHSSSCSRCFRPMLGPCLVKARPNRISASEFRSDRVRVKKNHFSSFQRGLSRCDVDLTGLWSFH